MNPKKQTLKYVLADYIMANIAWFLFNIVRFEKSAIYEGFWQLNSFLFSRDVLIGQLVVPFICLVIYYFSGYYNQPYRKSRLSELSITFLTSLITTILLFFIVIVDDLPPFYELYYKLTGALFVILFTLTYIVRLIITQITTNKIHKRKIGFNTIILGTGTKALEVYNNLNKMPLSLGYNILGFIPIESYKNTVVSKNLIIGRWDELDYLIKALEVKEIIIALESNNDEQLKHFYSLYKYNLPVKVVTDQHDILSGNIKMTTIYANPMYELFVARRGNMDANIKQFFDVFFSFFVLLLLSPLLLFLALRIKWNDRNAPVVFKQKRVGKSGKEFYMYKFRTMKINAELEGPSLSVEDDPRITSVGKWMRKYRLDELLQFWNVLKGDMSIVGPRPERQYFIDHIVKKAPYYYLLYRVKPGITSWGMVKYGYAQSVDEMIERLNYDIIYLENMSLMVDLKILIYTIKTVATGKGI
ncbi:MAG: sugar transferase [Candidatus Azobacteroides sp.]|nr:sugar transferase [Candidatus Azobacteroides sp.]